MNKKVQPKELYHKLKYWERRKGHLNYCPPCECIRNFDCSVCPLDKETRLSTDSGCLFFDSFEDHTEDKRDYMKILIKYWPSILLEER